MSYVFIFDCRQMMLRSWNSFVDLESIAKLIDAFADSLDLVKYGVKEVFKGGRSLYNPKRMYKLYYIYGNCKGIYSLRKLADNCRVNDGWGRAGFPDNF